MSRALVLGGGGPVGIAWETGLIAGLAEGGVDVSNADWILGTSAGSVVGAQLASGRTPADLLKAEFAQAERTKEASGTSGPAPDLGPLMALMMKRPAEGPVPIELLREFGTMALNAKTISEEVFLTGFGRLATPDQPWPERFACTAVDAETGAFQVWSNETAAPLGRGVASSCCVPGIFPPVGIEGRRYIDGGMRSGTNADLAHAYGKVLTIAVAPPTFAAFMIPGIERELDRVRAEGGEACLLVPDAASGEAFGPNLMDGSRREPIARAGFAQGLQEAVRVKAFWN